MLHRRAAPPMWSVDPTGWNRDKAGGVTLGRLELQVQSWSMGLFPFDRLDLGVNVGLGRAGRREGRLDTVGIPDLLSEDAAPRVEDYAEATLCIAGPVTHGILERRLPPVLSDDTAEAYRNAIEHIDRIERPGRRHDEGDLNRASEAFAALARRADIDPQVRLVGKLLAASFGATRSAVIAEEDAAALALL